MWVKICGVTSPEDARGVSALGPDAVGVNFYPGSKRCVSTATAAEIVAALDPQIEPVGIFVNQSAGEIRETCSATGIRTVQLHGDEPPELAEELLRRTSPAIPGGRGLRIIRAFRVGAEGLKPLAEELSRYSGLKVPLRGCLVDAHVEGTYGGTGRLAPWDFLAASWKQDWPPLVLSGGLNPENVRQAIREVVPRGVDVASGVESGPGRKDLKKVRQFIEQSRGET